MTMQYLVAAIKPWNFKQYEQLVNRDHENQWTLISDPIELDLGRLKKIQPKYIFFPHWSWIIPKEIWTEFECIAFHMTDLPFGRGGTPLQNLIANGIEKTMISAFRVNGQLDGGPIYMKRPLSLDGAAQEIYQKKSKVIFTEMIPEIIATNPKPKQQAGKPVEFTRRVPAQSEISDKMTINQIYDHIRMLDADGYPYAFLKIGKNKFLFKNVKKKDKSLEANVEIYEE